MRSIVSLFLFSPAALFAFGTSSVSLQLSSNLNPSVFGRAVTLTATVSPSTATGLVSFFDGTVPLGVSPLKSGQAALTSILSGSGSRLLTAYYSGLSAVLTQVVKTLPDGAIATPTSFGSFGSPDNLITGDFNRDGAVDFAVANISGVAVLLGTSNGTFHQTEELVTNSAPVAVAKGDFNGDGNVDLAVTNQNGTLTVFLGNGDGTFGAAINYPLPATDPGCIAVGDFNADGKDDLAICDRASSQVDVLLGKGDGTFSTASKYGVASAPNQLVIEDFNGDGKADLAVTATSANVISTLMGNGDGTFHAAVNYSVGSHPYAIAAGDLNGDGKPDLVVANQGASVSILIGNGDGTFRIATEIAVGSDPLSVAITDLNGDGKADFAVADFENNDIAVLLGNGDGTFRTPVLLPAGANPSSILVGDFNGDGRPDLAVANLGDDDVSVLIGIPQVVAGCTYSVTTSMPQVPTVGETVILSILTGAACPWVITGLPDWIAVAGTSTGSGASSIELVVAANSGAVRGTRLFVSNAYVDLNQLSSVLSVDSMGVVNAASYSTSVAPGGLAAIFGNFLLGAPLSATSLPVPTSLSGLSLQFGNNIAAPLFYVSSSQVNVQVPWELAGLSQTTISASLNSQTSFAQTIRVASYAPGIFSLNGGGQGAVLNAAYQLASAANPAARGTYVQIYCTGLGPVTNQPATGAAAPSAPNLAETTTMPTVTIGGVAATVVYAGLAPGTVGEYQVNALVPAGAPTGNTVPVLIVIGGVVSNMVMIAVQ